MQSPTISLSMMSFDEGPLMSEQPHVPVAPGELVGSVERPIEADLVLSLICESEPILLEQYRDLEPARRAG